MQSIATRSRKMSSLIWKRQGIIASFICVILAIEFVSKMVQNCYHQHHHGVTPPLIRLQLVRIYLSSLQRAFSVRICRRNVETANPRELKTLHVGKTRTTHGSKSHHGLRKWNSSLHQASSLKSFRTAFTHEHRNCKTGE